jgi:HAD superfamily phosphoserine phosphatase-like hydrolase
LEELLQKQYQSRHEQAPVAVFDFDNTCIRHDIGDALFDAMVLYDLFSNTNAFWELFPSDEVETLRLMRKAIQDVPWQERRSHSEVCAWRYAMHACLARMVEEKGEPQAYAWMVQLLVGLSPDKVRNIAQEVIAAQCTRDMGTETLEQPGKPPIVLKQGIRLYETMREFIFQLQLAGVEVWIVSASNLWTVQTFGQRFGIPANRVVGARLDIRNGLLTSVMSEPMTAGEGKVEAIKHHIGQQPILAGGDSINDREMLHYASEQRLVIAPRDDAFELEAEAEGWLIQPTLSRLVPF